MSGIQLVTKGFITQDIPPGSGSGGAGLSRLYDEPPKPNVLVTNVTIQSKDKVEITEATFKVKSLKIIKD